MQMLNNMLVITDDTAPILELHRREKSCLELRTYTKALWKASYHIFWKASYRIHFSREMQLPTYNYLGRTKGMRYLQYVDWHHRRGQE